MKTIGEFEMIKIVNIYIPFGIFIDFFSISNVKILHAFNGIRLQKKNMLCTTHC